MRHWSRLIWLIYYAEFQRHHHEILPSPSNTIGDLTERIVGQQRDERHKDFYLMTKEKQRPYNPLKQLRIDSEMFTPLLRLFIYFYINKYWIEKVNLLWKMAAFSSDFKNQKNKKNYHRRNFLWFCYIVLHSWRKTIPI